MSFELLDDTIMEGDPDDVALICLRIVDARREFPRDALGYITISDISTAEFDGM